MGLVGPALAGALVALVRPGPPSPSTRSRSPSRRSRCRWSAAAGGTDPDADDGSARRAGHHRRRHAGGVGGSRGARHDRAALRGFNLAFAGPVSVGLALLADQRFDGGSAAFGLLFSAFGGGAVVGAIGGRLDRAPRASERS